MALTNAVQMITAAIENDAASNHLIPVPLSGFQRDLNSVSSSAYSTILVDALQRQRQIPARLSQKTVICYHRNPNYFVKAVGYVVLD